MFWRSKKKPAPRPSSQQGFTLVEVLVAIVILATGLVLVVEAMGRTQQAFRISQNLVTASLLADERLAESELEVRDRRRLNFSVTSGREVFPGRIFQWQRTVRNYADPSLVDQTKLNEVEVELDWQEGGNRQNTLLLSSLILNREKKQQ